MSEVKYNFRNLYIHLNCENCEENDKFMKEIQEHVYNCIEIN